ncbi:MAG: hypothetical protein COZ56_04135, partial [Armatimonadetes bacterium CG_4_8_14_3_um_filter_58_9]
FIHRLLFHWPVHKWDTNHGSGKMERWSLGCAASTSARRGRTRRDSRRDFSRVPSVGLDPIRAEVEETLQVPLEMADSGLATLHLPLATLQSAYTR